MVKDGLNKKNGTQAMHKRVLGKHLQIGLLGDVFSKLVVKQNAFPPLIPLCRLFPNESIRTVSMQVDMFRDFFNCHGYVDTSAPFLVSCSGPRSSLCFKVTDLDMQEWGPNWVLQHKAFKNELEGIEWEDLQGKNISWFGMVTIMLNHGCHALEKVIWIFELSFFLIGHYECWETFDSFCYVF